MREEEPKEDPWALPQLFADEVYGDKKPERARTPESGEKKKRPRRRSRGHGGKKLADAQAAPKAAQEGAKSKGQPRQKSQPNRKSGARKPGDKPAGENAGAAAQAGRGRGAERRKTRRRPSPPPSRRARPQQVHDARQCSAQHAGGGIKAKTGAYRSGMHLFFCAVWFRSAVRRPRRTPVRSRSGRARLPAARSHRPHLLPCPCGTGRCCRPAPPCPRG